MSPSRHLTSSPSYIIPFIFLVTLFLMTLQFKYAENPETRRTAYEKFENRLAVNKPIMAKFLDLRRQIAKLLGYPTWADYVTEVKMVKDAKGVKTV